MGGGVAPTYEGLWANGVPGNLDPGTTAVVAANRVQFNVSGEVLALRYYRQVADQGFHLMYLRLLGPGLVLAAKGFKVYNPVGAQPAGWETRYLTPVLKVTAGQVYQLGCIYSAGRRSWMIGAHFPDADVTIGNFTLPADTPSALNGAFSTVLTFNPQSSEGASKLALDFWFRQT